MLKKLSSVKNNLKSTPVRKNIPSKANIFGATKKHLTSSSFVKSYNFQQKSFFGSVNKSHSINNFNQRSNFQKSWNKSLNQTISKPLFQKNFYFNNKNASMHTFSLTKKYTQTPQKYQLQHYKLTEKVPPLSINLSSRFTLPKTNFTLFQNNNNNHFQTRFFSAGPPELTKEEVTTRVIDCVKNFEKVDGTMEVTPETHFQRDLGLDSLDVVEIGLALEETFAIEIPDQDAEALHTVGDCITYIFNHPRAK